MASLAARPAWRSALSVVARSSRVSGCQLIPLVIARRSVSTQSITPAEANEILVKQRGNRPTSPNLTIYKPQITWYLSGLHRITGVALASGVYALGLGYLFAPVFGYSLTSTAIASAFGAFPVVLKFGIKMLASFPFTFHSFNGVRHLIWDTATELTNKAVVRTGFTVLGLSAVTSIVLALL
ncbi:hypothetical protein V1520DRAFT_335975 [Lipomyces starkeyi]|uniref:Uncharacterized protein n=1 Tax=Lipomyces starkeyi NRRL Y-11557 TaxID=675824 RepID=A0A1E3QF00_LIPST|nr:hypothetical protein LIPSTDRAFT_151 [Lipomyces starkeyi NRRL Y-11557]